MDLTRLPAAGGSLLLNGLILAGLATLAAPQAIPEVGKPIQVALIPPQPLPMQEQPAARPPEPLPVSNTPPAPPRAEPKPRPPKPRPVVRQQPAPTPAATPVTMAPPVAVAAPTEEARPATITAEPAPPSAPIAPVVAAPPAPPPAPQKTETVREGPRVDASWQGNAPPPYPLLARRMGDQGEVRLDVQVAPSGQVTEVKLKKSSGSSLLDQTAMDTVRKWRFKPATVDGKPIAEWYYNWRWVFKLES